MPGIPDKVTGKTQWSCDVTLPGMLHARMVRPATLGSTLISVGELDKKRFPRPKSSTRQLVAVVSPDEWEADQRGTLGRRHYRNGPTGPGFPAAKISRKLSVTQVGRACAKQRRIAAEVNARWRRAQNNLRHLRTALRQARSDRSIRRGRRRPQRRQLSPSGRIPRNRKDCARRSRTRSAYPRKK